MLIINPDDAALAPLSVLCKMQIKALFTGILIFGPSSVTVKDTKTILVPTCRFPGILISLFYRFYKRLSKEMSKK